MANTAKPDPIYLLYKSNPPKERRGVTPICAYWHGFDGTAKKYVRGSKAWWAQKAGREARLSGPTPDPERGEK